MNNQMKPVGKHPTELSIYVSVIVTLILALSLATSTLANANEQQGSGDDFILGENTRVVSFNENEESQLSEKVSDTEAYSQYVSSTDVSETVSVIEDVIEISKETAELSINDSYLDNTIDTINSSLNNMEGKVNEKIEEKNRIDYLVNTKYGVVPMPYEHKLKVIQECEKRGLFPGDIFGLIKLESTFNPNAASKKSTARGYGQILRGTGASLYKDLYGGGYNHDMAFDPYLNIEMICYYVSKLYKSSGSMKTALIRYNGGELGVRYYNIVMTYSNKFR